jgi:hypothetical protein
VLIGYGLAMGTMSVLVVPARDARLTRVVSGGVPRAAGRSSDERPQPLRPLRRTPSTMRRLGTRKTTSRGKALSAAPAMMGP